MTDSEREKLAELMRDGTAEDLVMLLEHSTPSKRAAYREYLAGWADAVKSLTNDGMRPEVDEFIQRLEDEAE